MPTSRLENFVEDSTDGTLLDYEILVKDNQSKKSHPEANDVCKYCMED